MLPFIFQEAKESIDEKDPRPTSSNGAYIMWYQEHLHLDELSSLKLWKEKQERKEKGKKRVEEISQDERKKIREEEIRKIMKEMKREKHASYSSHNSCKSLSEELRQPLMVKEECKEVSASSKRLVKKESHFEIKKNIKETSPLRQPPHLILCKKTLVSTATPLGLEVIPQVKELLDEGLVRKSLNPCALLVPKIGVKGRSPAYEEPRDLRSNPFQGGGDDAILHPKGIG
ncbi:hypothetical protein HKD37_03G006998 [Glycine soja]